jgi:hypothetical protein
MRCAVKAAAVTVVAVVADWLLLHLLYAWADRAADAQIASGASDSFGAAFFDYVAADVVIVLFVPIAVLAGLRLLRVKGNHLAVLLSGLTWYSFTHPRLDIRAGAGTFVLGIGVAVLMTAAGSALQALAATPEVRQ